MRKILKKLILTLILTEPLYGAQSIESMEHFYKAINNDLVIARFYYKNGEIKNNPTLYQQYKNVSNAFKATEKIENVVSFIKINIEREHLKNLATSYKIKTTPTFILFRYGEKIATLTNIKSNKVTIPKIQKFIKDHFENLIIEKIKKLAEEQRVIDEQRRLRQMWYYYNAPYYYQYPYPYYYYPRYWGPYNRRYPYRRPYRGSGVYIGVGF